MKLFPAKCHERATLRKLWRQTGNSLPLLAKCWPLLHVIDGILARFSNFNDWSLGEQWILFPSNLNVSLDFVSGKIEIRGKQNSLFPSGIVIKCYMLTLHDLEIQAIIFKKFVVTLRIWTRPTNMSSRISSNLLTADRGRGGGGVEGPLYGLYEYVPRDRVDRFWSSWSLQRVSFLSLFALCSQCDP